MKFIEVWRGTPEEIRAGSTVKRLSGKPNLSVSQKKELVGGRELRRGLSRRRFILGGVGAAALIAGGGTGFLLKQGFEENLNTEGMQDGTLSIDSIESWRELPPRERLQRLFQKNTPELEGFDKLQEAVQASADFYVSQVPSNFSAEELVNRTKFVETNDEYAELAIKFGNLRLSNPNMTREESKKDFAENRSNAFTSKPEGNVYVSMQGIEDRLQAGISARKDFAEESRRTDLKVAFISNSLLHEYGHVNQQKDVFTLSTPIEIQAIDGVIKLRGLQGLRVQASFTGETLIGDDLPTDEGIVEAQARELSIRAGNNILKYAQTYEAERQWVSDLNKLAGVTFNELADCISGKVSLIRILSKWGSLDLSGLNTSRTPQEQIAKGITVLGVIGIYTRGWTNVDSAYMMIMNELGPNTSIQTAPLPLTPQPTLRR